MKSTVMKCAACLLSALLWAAVVHARPPASVKYSTTRAENPKGLRNSLVIPYGFSSDSMGFTVGVGGGMRGYGQDQLLVAGTGWVSFDGGGGGILGLWDYRLPRFQRFFLSAFGSAGYYPNQRAYANAPRPPGVPRSGSNDSDENDFVEDSGWDNQTDFRLEYVLPLGSARHQAMAAYHLKGGLLTAGGSGGDVWNPLSSGVSVVVLRQFNRYQSFNTDFGKKDYTVHPVQLGLYYNNTDFAVNPSRGSSQFLGVTRDFGWLESDESWTFLEFEASKYFSLGDSRWARQRIVALNFWTGDSPTWDMTVDAGGYEIVRNAPPFTQGANLGGFYRMRGYPFNRFHDRSVIYTTAEYRYTLKWNPMGNISWLKFLNTDWMQLVGFVEGGRVADEYDLGELLSDWKFDAGAGLRFLMSGGIIRVDFAVSDEGSQVWAMFGHPF